MKIITKILLLTIILIFFPLKSFAHVEHYEKVEKFLMEIFKDGKKIGFNNYTFNKNKENLVISGPYNSVNSVKNDYILLKTFGFEELDIFFNE